MSTQPIRPAHSADPTLPDIPRAQWTAHPRFESQALLLGSHENFRAISRHLVTAAEAGESDVGIGALYWRWIAAMRSHEAYEEHKLYRFLAHRWGADFSIAQAGHVALHERDRAVRSALVTPEDRTTLSRALREHDEALVAHLEHEEDLVLPLLLELSPAEFESLRTFAHRSAARGTGPRQDPLSALGGKGRVLTPRPMFPRTAADLRPIQSRHALSMDRHRVGIGRRRLGLRR